MTPMTAIDDTQTFWLIREVPPYGADCEVVSPANVRERLQQTLRAMCRRYNLTVLDSVSHDP